MEHIEQGIEDAHNLKEISISSTEPTADEVLWVKKGEGIDTTLNIKEKDSFDEIFNFDTTNIQTINNNNGTAILFPDGTMICSGKVSSGTYNTSTCLSDATWNYPKEFIASPVVIANATGGNAYAYTTLVVAEEKKAVIQVKRLGNTTVAFGDASKRDIACIAIGKWK